MSSLITLSWSLIGLSSSTSKTCIKYTSGSNLVDFDGGFSYIINSWSTEEEQKPIDMASYITTFCSTSSKYIYIYIGFFSGGLLQHFVGITISTCVVGLASKIALARVPAAC